MDRVKAFVDSTVGQKVIVAVTGIAMIGFIVSHLTANLMVFGDPKNLYDYAVMLREFPVLLWVARGGLLATVFLHVYFTVKLTRTSLAARPVAYKYRKNVQSTFQSRYMALSGLMLLAFIVYHIAHYTLKVTSPELQSLDPMDVHGMLVQQNKNPFVAITYVVAMIFVGLHLSHGISSLFQTLGLCNGKHSKMVRYIGPLIGSILALGFISIPVAIYTGCIH